MKSSTSKVGRPVSIRQADPSKTSAISSENVTSFNNELYSQAPKHRSRISVNPFTMAQVLNAIYKYAIPLAVGVSFAQASIYDVKGGTRAVIFDRLSGVKDQVVNEGTHFLIPWLQKSIIYDVRTKPRNISTTTGSKDLQMVSLTLRVLHRPEVKALPKIYQV
jgi:SPFH domain / Band 7 family